MHTEILGDVSVCLFHLDLHVGAFGHSPYVLYYTLYTISWFIGVYMYVHMISYSCSVQSDDSTSITTDHNVRFLR